MFSVSCAVKIRETALLCGQIFGPLFQIFFIGANKMEKRQSLPPLVKSPIDRRKSQIDMSLLDLKHVDDFLVSYQFFDQTRLCKQLAQECKTARALLALYGDTLQNMRDNIPTLLNQGSVLLGVERLVFLRSSSFDIYGQSASSSTVIADNSFECMCDSQYDYIPSY